MIWFEVGPEVALGCGLLAPAATISAWSSRMSLSTCWTCAAFNAATVRNGSSIRPGVWVWRAGSSPASA